MERSRNTCFTSYDDSEPKFTPMMKYLVFQREKCPTTGKPHWQGYVEWVQPMEYKKMSEELELKSVHYESRKGSPLQASEYCKKTDSRLSLPKEFGTLSAQGTRSDINAIAQSIGKRKYRDLIDENREVYVKFHRGFDRLHSLFALSKMREVKVTYIWGEPGIGKSHSVWTPEMIKSYEEGDVYCATDNSQGWLDGYLEQRIIYFDDFDGLWPLKDMLRLTDKYPCSGWVKGGKVNMLHTQVIFSSNKPPESYYGADPAWLRRLENVIRAKPARGAQGGRSPPLEELPRTDGTVTRVMPEGGFPGAGADETRR